MMVQDQFPSCSKADKMLKNLGYALMTKEAVCAACGRFLCGWFSFWENCCFVDL